MHLSSDRTLCISGCEARIPHSAQPLHGRAEAPLLREAALAPIRAVEAGAARRVARGPRYFRHATGSCTSPVVRSVSLEPPTIRRKRRAQPGLLPATSIPPLVPALPKTALSPPPAGQPPTPSRDATLAGRRNILDPLRDWDRVGARVRRGRSCRPTARSATQATTCARKTEFGEI